MRNSETETETYRAGIHKSFIGISDHLQSIWGDKQLNRDRNFKSWDTQMSPSLTGISDRLQSILGDKGQRGRGAYKKSWDTHMSPSFTSISDHLQSILGDE